MNKIDLTKWVIKGLRKKSYSYQIEEYIIDQIKNYALQPGEVLPSVRELAKVNGLDKNTVHIAYYKLISKGWLTYSHGRRTKVSFNFPSFKLKHTQQEVDIPEYLKPDVKRIKDFWPASIQNFIAIGPQKINESWSAETLISKYAKKYREQRMVPPKIENKGEERSSILTKSVVEHLNLTRGFQTQSNNVPIVRGRSESIKNIFHLLFTTGDIVINTSPADFLINWILKEGSVQMIKIDIDGVNFLKNLKNTVSNKQVKAVYIRPGATYPKGRSLDQETSLALIELAQQYHFLIIEEDDDHEFWHGDKPFLPLITYPSNGHVIYTGALSRLSPYLQTLRTIVAPTQIIELLVKLPLSIYEIRDTSEELAIAHVLSTGELATYVRRARKQKHVDLVKIDNIFKTFLKDYIQYDLPTTGLSIWLEFTEKVNLSKMLNLLSKAGFPVPYFPEIQRLLPKVYNMRFDFSCFQEIDFRDAVLMIQKIYYRLINE